MATDHYDVIIIGSGAGGGTLAYRLAPTGKRILIIERGEFVPREKENWDSRAVVVENRYHINEAWLDKKGHEFHAGTHYYVGGNTKFYGAALIRLREQDFGELKHHDGVSPAWPIDYNTLEPYYTEAEKLYFVHGERGADPTEPCASAPYDYPALSHEPRIREIYDGLKKQGCKPFPMPVGIMRDEKDLRRSKCIRCNTCDGFPCLVHAKADAEVVCVEPALRHSNVRIMTGAYVERLETDASGKSISNVVVKRNGGVETLSANIVVSSCGAINSAALLLRSANGKHPNGLANGSDQVGRNYMCHVNSMYLALSQHRNDTKFNKTLGLNDFYFGADDYHFPMGHISLISAIDANILRAGAPRFTPTKPLEVMAEHAVPFWCTTEDLPDAKNRVLLSKDGRITLDYTPNNETSHKRLLDKLKGLLKQIEFEEHLIPLQAYVPGRIPLAGVAHQNGTLRFGTDAATSVLDTNCRAHEIDNLYAVDGSFFPSCGAVNPALTIIANALRVGDHLKARLS